MKSQKSTGRLVKYGLTYSQIADLLSKVIEDGFASFEQERLVLTNSGEEQLKYLYNRYHKKIKENVSQNNKIDPLEDTFIYVPKRDTIVNLK